MKYPDIIKIDKIKLNSSKLLKIKLIKDRIYKKNHYIKNINIENLEHKLKKAFYIIYLYSIYKKRILFVGGSLEICKQIKKILKNTKHSIIPELGWVPGIITNKRTSIKSLLLSLFDTKKTNVLNLSRNLIHMKRKTDLIVILDENKNKTALYEGYLINIPIISLNSNSLNLEHIYTSYKVPGDFYNTNTLLQNNLLLILLKALLKTTKLNKYSIINYTLNTIKNFQNSRNQKHPYRKFKKRYYKKKYNKHGNKKSTQTNFI